MLHGRFTSCKLRYDSCSWTGPETTVLVDRIPFQMTACVFICCDHMHVNPNMPLDHPFPPTNQKVQRVARCNPESLIPAGSDAQSAATPTPILRDLLHHLLHHQCVASASLAACWPPLRFPLLQKSVISASVLHNATIRSNQPSISPEATEAEYVSRPQQASLDALQGWIRKAARTADLELPVLSHALLDVILEAQQPNSPMLTDSNLLTHHSGGSAHSLFKNTAVDHAVMPANDLAATAPLSVSDLAVVASLKQVDSGSVNRAAAQSAGHQTKSCLAHQEPSASLTPTQKYCADLGLLPGASDASVSTEFGKLCTLNWFASPVKCEILVAEPALSGQQQASQFSPQSMNADAGAAIVAEQQDGMAKEQASVLKPFMQVPRAEQFRPDRNLPSQTCLAMLNAFPAQQAHLAAVAKPPLTCQKVSVIPTFGSRTAGSSPAAVDGFSNSEGSNHAQSLVSLLQLLDSHLQELQPVEIPRVVGSLPGGSSLLDHLRAELINGPLAAVVPSLSQLMQKSAVEETHALRPGTLNDLIARDLYPGQERDLLLHVLPCAAAEMSDQSSPGMQSLGSCFSLLI